MEKYTDLWNNILDALTPEVVLASLAVALLFSIACVYALRRELRNIKRGQNKMSRREKLHVAQAYLSDRMVDAFLDGLEANVLTPELVEHYTLRFVIAGLRDLSPRVRDVKVEKLKADIRDRLGTHKKIPVLSGAMLATKDKKNPANEMDVLRDIPPAAIVS